MKASQKRKLSDPIDSSPSKLPTSTDRRHSEEQDINGSTVRDQLTQDRILSKRRSVHSASSSSSQQSTAQTTKKRTVRKYCLCQTPYNREQFYIQCDSCDEWYKSINDLGTASLNKGMPVVNPRYHGKCVMLSENLGEQIEKWFCPICVKEKDLELKWKPDCAREECKERIRTESLFCSEECGIMVMNAKLQKVLPSLTPLFKRRGTEPDVYRKEDLKALANVAISRKTREREIRCLEKRQILIDEAIETVRNINQSREQKICGFDERICTKWISSNTQFFGSFDHSEDDQEMDVTTASDDESLLCQNVAGKCLFHDGWEYLKSKDVAMELHEQIKQYCLEKQKEVDLALRLLDLQSVLVLDQEFNLGVLDTVDPPAVDNDADNEDIQNNGNDDRQEMGGLDPIMGNEIGVEITAE